MGYRQGMHELLAPLIFVIHCDQQTCAHACEVEESVPPLVKTLLEEKCLEPDAYDMFCRMMDIMEPLHHPPPNAWNSPKHQTKLSQLMGTASSSHQSASTGSSNKVHPATSDRKTSTHSSSLSTATAR